MAKLMDLFGRKGIDISADDEMPAPPPHRPIPVREHVSAEVETHETYETPEPLESPVESYSHVGSRIGGENEALRNLFNDASRKIDELDELKRVFDRLVTPFNATLRALEEEKSQTLSLTAMLEEARASHDGLRNEFYQIERRASSLDADVERLREDLEAAHEANRSLESTGLELSNEASANRAQIAELERQLAQETSQRRALSESRRGAQEQLDAAEKRIVELEGELAATGERLVLMEDDRRSLQTAVDNTLAENARLSRRLTESENALSATRSQLGKVEASYAETYAERGRIAGAFDEAREQYQVEHNAMTMRLDALTSRAATAERLLAHARESLIARTEELRAFDRKAVEATIARNNAEKRLTQMESAHESRDQHLRDLEQTRVGLGEHNSALTKELKAREAALARGEEKLAALAERNAQLEADAQVVRTTIERRVEELSASLQRERMERAVLEGALEAARKDNTRLQSEVTSLRTALRRGIPLDETAITPSPPANEDDHKTAEEPTPPRAVNAGPGDKS